MSLLEGHYVECARSFESAWELVLQALEASSTPGFDWQVEPDKEAKRIHATMDFGNAFEVKRHLSLELVFSQIGDALRLEMHYVIIPMVNIGQSEKLLQKARDKIGQLLTAGQELYQVGVIPANSEVRTEVESSDRLLQCIEMVLLLNFVLVLIFSLATKSLQSAMSMVLMLQFLWIPIAVFYALFSGFSKLKAGSSWSFGSVIMFTGGVIGLALGGIAISAIAFVIILLGLCGALFGHSQG